MIFHVRSPPNSIPFCVFNQRNDGMATSGQNPQVWAGDSDATSSVRAAPAADGPLPLGLVRGRRNRGPQPGGPARSWAAECQSQRP